MYENPFFRGTKCWVTGPTALSIKAKGCKLEHYPRMPVRDVVRR